MKIFGENKKAGKIMPRPAEQKIFCAKDNGYRGAWHAQPPLFEHGYKYSGGLGTYCSSHSPFAIFAKEVGKTFFCWGGMAENQSFRPRNWDFCPGQQLHMVSYFDHKTGLVPRPTILFDKYCADTHDNPVISIDDKGYIWIFSPSHGQWTTPSFIHRSVEPYSIDKFETVSEALFAYPQPHWLNKHGFVFLHTRYQDGRMLHVQNSIDGREWSDARPIAGIEQGHYHVSASFENKIFIAFNFHPQVGGLDARTNLYCMQSFDGGKNWQNMQGEILNLPLCEIRNPALVCDYRSEGRLVYIMDINIDRQGNPAILYILGRSHVPGPDTGPREWVVSRWTGVEWKHSKIAESDCNYDCGSLFIDENEWFIIGPTEKGHQPWTPGGEMARWSSIDGGETWTKDFQITKNSEFNHTYARRVQNYHKDFVALWADGDTRNFSHSFLYFCGIDAKRVFRLPPLMTKDFAEPEEL